MASPNVPGGGGVPGRLAEDGWCAPGVSCTERITIDASQRGGEPCICGLRIVVQDVLEYLASGMTEDQILSDFPEPACEDIRACLAFAANRERRFVSAPGD